MASAELSRHVGKVIGYPPLCEMGERQRREFHEALLEANSFSSTSPGRWQAAVVAAEHNRPKLRGYADPRGPAVAAPSRCGITRDG